MKTLFKRLFSSTALLIPVIASATTIQFGGEVSNWGDSNWQADINADQIIDWQGRGKDGTKRDGAGAHGTFDDVASGSLTSLNNEVTLSLVSASSADPSPVLGKIASVWKGGLGVDTDGDKNAAALESTSEEILTFSFNKDVTLVQFVAAGMGKGWQRIGIDIGADGSYEFDVANGGFNVGAGTVTGPVTYGQSLGYLFTLDTPLVIEAGTQFSVTSLGGTLTFRALVVETVPES